MLSFSYIPAPAKFGNLDHCDNYYDPLCEDDGGGGGGGGELPALVLPPSWMIGSFYSADTNGVPVVLTISANGTVIFYYNGTHQGHTIAGGYVDYDFGVHNVTQTTNGIKTTSSYGTTEYSRSPVTTHPCAAVTCEAGSNPAVINGVCQCISAVNPQGDDNTPTACTTDAKLCSDGSYVGRDPNNNCAWKPCPQPQTGGVGGDVNTIINNAVNVVKANPLPFAIGAGALALFLLRD